MHEYHSGLGIWEANSVIPAPQSVQLKGWRLPGPSPKLLKSNSSMAMRAAKLMLSARSKDVRTQDVYNRNKHSQESRMSVWGKVEGGILQEASEMKTFTASHPSGQQTEEAASCRQLSRLVVASRRNNIN